MPTHRSFTQRAEEGALWKERRGYYAAAVGTHIVGAYDARSCPSVLVVWSLAESDRQSVHLAWREGDSLVVYRNQQSFLNKLLSGRCEICA